MRFRRGAQDVFFRDDALGGNCVGNVIIDHCSASWGLDENMSVYRHVYNRDSTGAWSEASYCQHNYSELYFFGSFGLLQSCFQGRL